MDTISIKSLKNDKNKDEKIKNIIIEELPHLTNLILDKPLQTLLCFYPLPYEFQIDYFNDNEKVIKKNNTYFYLGYPGDRILYANKRLPFYNQDPIPFSFPITKNGITKMIQSNIFYYEVTFGDKPFRKPWKNECLSIGFGVPSTPIKSQVGWFTKSWGFHSDDGSFIHNNSSIPITYPWKFGETYGVGLRYMNKFKYELFLTKNGLVVIDNIFIEISEYLIPMIGFDLSIPIKVNWGQEEFKYNLENIICSDKILSHKNNFLKKSFNKNLYKISPHLYKIIPNLGDVFENINDITSPLNLPNFYSQSLTNLLPIFHPPSFSPIHKPNLDPMYLMPSPIEHFYDTSNTLIL